jgi:hypothetical protein
MWELAYGEETVDRTQVFFKWFCKFQTGKKSVKNADCLGIPLISKTDVVVDWGKNLVFENSRMTIYEVANIMGIPFGSCHSILKDRMWIRFLPNLYFFVCMNFRPKTKMTCATHFLLTTVSSVWLLPHLMQRQKSQDGVKGKDIRYYYDSGKISGHIC